MSDRLRKSTKKQVISIILVLTLLLSVILSGCHGQSSEIQNKKFRKFTETLFCQEVASNTVSLHYTLKDPGQYGIQASRLHSDILIRIKEPEKFPQKIHRQH